jgi:photosystem II stability/assembly factor-like uncharacterized protein
LDLKSKENGTKIKLQLFSFMPKYAVMLRLSLFLLSLFSVGFVNAQTIELLSSGSKASLRGLSVVDDQIVWASGSAGTVLKSVDAGMSWKKINVPGFEKTDFRDIEAFDENNAVIMGIDSPGVILKTNDGGQEWKLVYRNDTKGIFLDAMEFLSPTKAVVIGDPIDGQFFMAVSEDGGEHWREENQINRPIADTGEACFASSGTNIRKLSGNSFVFISGGLHSKMFNKNKSYKLPIIQGMESTGANSIAVKNKKCLMIVGGDFNQKDSANQNCFFTTDGGKKWKSPLIGPGGYRSCVEYLGKEHWIACGLNGVDWTIDGGNTFVPISKTGFHVCRKAKKGNAVFFAGGNGKIGKFIN